MERYPYAVSTCFRMARSNAIKAEYLRFEQFFQTFNIKVHTNGWLEWTYYSDVLENYLLDFQVALQALRGGASLSLHFYLVEYEPDTDVLAGGTPTTFRRVSSVPMTHRSLLHTAAPHQVQGGLIYNLSMKLEPQKSITLPVYTQKTRWFRVFVAYQPPAACTDNDDLLAGFGVPVLAYQEGLLSTSSYITERMPFVQMEVVRLSNPLDVADLAALQIPSFGDLKRTEDKAVEKSHSNLLLDLGKDTSDVSKAIIKLVDSEGSETIIEDVREALIEDLSDNTSKFSEAVLDLVNGTVDFIVEPSEATITVGDSFDFTIDLFGGLDVASIQALSNDTTVATLNIDTVNKKITVLGVAPGTTTVTVSSSAISKTVVLSITVEEPPLVPDFNITADDTQNLIPNTAVVGFVDAVYNIELIDGADLEALQVVSSDVSIATITRYPDVPRFDVVAVKAGEEVTVTVSSTETSKTQSVTVRTLPYQSTFKATNVVGDLIPAKMWASLNTTTGELTLDSPNGSNIIMAGWVSSVDSTANTAVIRYLYKNFGFYPINLEAGYTPLKNSPVIIADGIGKAVGYTVPNCTYSRVSTSGSSVNVSQIVSDIDTLEQHKVS